MKKTELSFSKPFVAAYSKYPFSNEATTPDYRFDHNGDTYWALKVGEMHIPWGVGAKLFRAYGFVTVERQNVNWFSLDARDLPFRQRGDVHYLYMEEEEGFAYVGFLPHLSRIYINPLIENIVTDDMDVEAFKTAVQQLSPDNNDRLKEMTEKHALTFKSITIERIGKKE